MSKQKEKENPEEEKKDKETIAPEEETLSVPKAEFDSVLSRLKELEEMKDRMLRTAADFDNAKKRLHKDREEFIKFSQERLLKEILPVLENFERALAHHDGDKEEDSPESQQLKSMMTGIRRVHKQLVDVLKNQGMVRLQTQGQTFDPNLHEAIGFVQEEGREDEIIEEIEPGYQLHDRLIRAAKVRVRIAPQDDRKEDSPQISPEEEKQEEIT